MFNRFQPKFPTFERSDKRLLFWNKINLYSSTFFNLANGLLLIPLYVRYIPLDLWGLWAATGNILAWITIFDPGFSGIVKITVSREYFSKTKMGVGRIVPVVLLNGFIISFLVAICFLVLYNYLPEFLGTLYAQNSEIQLSVLFTMISVCIYLLTYNIHGINLGLQSSCGASVTYILYNVIGIFLTIVLLYMGYGILSIGISNLVKAILYFFGHSLYLFFRINDERIKLCFRFKELITLYKLLGLGFVAKGFATLHARSTDFLVGRFLSFDFAGMLRIFLGPIEICKNLLPISVQSSSQLVHRDFIRNDFSQVALRLRNSFKILIWVFVFISVMLINYNLLFVEYFAKLEIKLTGLEVHLLVFYFHLLVVADTMNLVLWHLGKERLSVLYSVTYGIIALFTSLFALVYFGFLCFLIVNLFIVTISTLLYMRLLNQTIEGLLKINRTSLFKYGALFTIFYLCQYLVRIEFLKNLEKVIGVSIIMALLYLLLLFLIFPELRAVFKMRTNQVIKRVVSKRKF